MIDFITDNWFYINGLLLISIGSQAQSSSYAVLITRVKQWQWESFWLVQGIFAWLVFPYIGAAISLPAGASLWELYAGENVLMPIVFGILWGVGGLTFGLSMRYLGVALGQSIALGMCSACGTMLPALMGEGTASTVTLSICVAVMLAGVAVIGYAGKLRELSMSEEERRKAIRDFAFSKGLLVAVIAGVMSACFKLGLNAGNPIKEAGMTEFGVHPLLALSPVILLVTVGGFVTNVGYCLFCNAKNKTFSDYFCVKPATFISNILFCALSGLLWYLQFFTLGVGEYFLKDYPVALAFSWSILMAQNVIFSIMWGLILKEWKGSGRKAGIVLVAGMLVLIFSLILPKLI
ncbi:MAG: rhamnose/proton symporter RhaT [Tannerellaceae bacterium]|jgi:L-rhamnose-H+ transport protein|nr:rhamnose/proton symporter RhaT [Tannerellaceae bacterium]